MPDILHDDATSITIASNQSTLNVEVFVNGSMRYSVTTLDVPFHQPKILQTVSYAQGGLSNINVTIVIRDGPELGFFLQASIEI